MTATIATRFWAKVDINGPVPKHRPGLGCCWVWTKTKTHGGYGQFCVSGSGPTRVRTYAHRWAYENKFGPIPDELELDHLCRRRNCVRPSHLQPVTHAENHRRRVGIKTGPYNVGTHCKHGHERTPENTGINNRGARICRACARDVSARQRTAQKQPTA